MLLVCSPTGGHAWWCGGHELMTRAAVRALPAELPSFLRTGEAAVVRSVADPDLFKNRDTPHLRDAEQPEHYWDAELLRPGSAPDTRAAFFDTCVAQGLSPFRVGLLPYAIAEWTERLAVALAEHRRWPEDERIQHKCLVYAGVLAHYAQDACQPLHVTRDYDGRPAADGAVVGRGIHDRLDSLPERLRLQPERLAAAVSLPRIKALMPAIWAQIEASRARLDAVYALASALATASSGEALGALGEERAVAAAAFTAALYWYAWEASAQIAIPAWHSR